VLALGEERPDIGSRVLKLRDALRSYGLRLDQAGTLAALGILALLPADETALAGRVRTADDDLRSRKGFSGWSVSRPERLLLAVSLAALEFTEANDAWAPTLATRLIDIILAQQTAIAVTVAVTAATSSSS